MRRIDLDNCASYYIGERLVLGIAPTILVRRCEARRTCGVRGVDEKEYVEHDFCWADASGVFAETDENHDWLKGAPLTRVSRSRW